MLNSLIIRNHLVHGGIRHLEIAQLVFNVSENVHGGIRHLENAQI